MAIRYQESLKGISAGRLTGFFVGWPKPPTSATHLKLLKNSDFVVLALDDGSRKVIGFITAITDNVLSAYIPFLEVLPEYQGRGIGGALVRRMLASLRKAYMVDLICDPALQKFYKKLKMFPASGMMLRAYRNQSGRRIV